MSFKSLFTTLVLLPLFFTARAQQDTTNQLTLSLGPAHLSRQDLIFSPFIHQDIAPLVFGLKHEWNKKSHQYVRLNYAGFSAGLETPYDYIFNGEVMTAYPHSFTFVSLGYGMGKYVGHSEKHPSMVGGALTLDVQALDYQYGRSSYFGYFSTVGLSAWYKYTFFQGKKSRLTGRIEVPLVSWLARSPYLINDDEFIQNAYSHNGFKTFFAFMGDGHLATWGELNRANIDIEYQYRLSDKFSLGAAWRLGFIHAGKPVDLFSYQQGLEVMVGMKL
ncbi:MAG: hypothetical protein IPL92_14675 [Saprospiraceae bacterium]|nr:hypothetical protein [Candidatus Opimibacter iunctus]